MKALLSLFLLPVCVCNLAAQTLLLKSGQSVPANDFARKDDLLMVAVTTPAGTRGQVGYHLSDIVELNFPPPPILAEAADLIAKGHADQALAKIDPIVALHQTVRDIPGNWWAKTDLVKCSALIALNRNAEASALLKDLVEQSHDPEIQLAAKLQLALLEPPKDPTAALASYDAVIKESSDPKTLTQAWMAAGDLRIAQHEFDEALLAYLTIVVFYPDHNPLIPKALWGAAQAYAKLKDTKNQDAILHELVTNYPNNPEASLAKMEIQKKENKK